jgi:hypothetical protein
VCEDLQVHGLHFVTAMLQDVTNWCHEIQAQNVAPNGGKAPVKVQVYAKMRAIGLPRLTIFNKMLSDGLPRTQAEQQIKGVFGENVVSDGAEWAEVVDGQGRTYFWNRLTSETSWTRPVNHVRVSKSRWGPVVAPVVAPVHGNSSLHQTGVEPGSTAVQPAWLKAQQALVTALQQQQETGSGVGTSMQLEMQRERLDVALQARLEQQRQQVQQEPQKLQVHLPGFCKGALVRWQKNSVLVPAGCVGTITKATNPDGTCNVEFPGGKWAFPLKELMLVEQEQPRQQARKEDDNCAMQRLEKQQLRQQQEQQRRQEKAQQQQEREQKQWREQQQQRQQHEQRRMKHQEEERKQKQQKNQGRHDHHNLDQRPGLDGVGVGAGQPANRGLGRGRAAVQPAWMTKRDKLQQSNADSAAQANDQQHPVHSTVQPDQFISEVKDILGGSGHEQKKNTELAFLSKAENILSGGGTEPRNVQVVTHSFMCSPLGFSVKDADGSGGVAVGKISDDSLPLRVGDVIVGLGGQNVSQCSRKEVVEQIKTHGFPLKITFEQEPTPAELHPRNSSGFVDHLVHALQSSGKDRVAVTDVRSVGGDNSTSTANNNSTTNTTSTTSGLNGRERAVAGPGSSAINAYLRQSNQQHTQHTQHTSSKLASEGDGKNAASTTACDIDELADSLATLNTNSSKGGNTDDTDTESVSAPVQDEGVLSSKLASEGDGENAASATACDIDELADSLAALNTNSSKGGNTDDTDTESASSPVEVVEAVDGAAKYDEAIEAADEGVLTIRGYESAIERGDCKPYSGKRCGSGREMYATGWAFKLSTKKWVKVDESSAFGKRAQEKLREKAAEADYKAELKEREDKMQQLEEKMQQMQHVEDESKRIVGEMQKMKLAQQQSEIAVVPVVHEHPLQVPAAPLLILLDTNVYMQDIQLVRRWVYNISYQLPHVSLLVPRMVLEELDRHKMSFNQDKAYSARQAVNLLTELRDQDLRSQDQDQTARYGRGPQKRREYSVMRGQADDELYRDDGFHRHPASHRGDEAILNCALFFAKHPGRHRKGHKVHLVTGDKNFLLRADSAGVRATKPEKCRELFC